MKRVNCIGAVLVDALSWPMDKFPEPGKKGGIETESITFSPGGGAANTGSALAQLGVPVKVFSKTGNDFSGRFIIENLQGKGVDTGGIFVADNESTAFVYIGVQTNGDCSFFITNGTNKSLCLQDFDKESLFDCEILLYQDFGSLPGLDPDATGILKEAKKRGIITIVDENKLTDIQLLKEVLPYTDYFMPGHVAMKQIMPDLNREQIAARLKSMGTGIVVLKLSEDGCLFLSDEGLFIEPSHATKIVDTTGGGDCFDGGFIAGLATGQTLKECIEIANDVAAVAIAAIGAAPKIPPLAELTRKK